MMYVFKSERHLQQKTFVVWHLFNSQSISLYNATYISSSVEDICTCSCRLHMNVIMNFVSTLSWIARYLEFVKVWCAACIVKRGKKMLLWALWRRVHIGCPDLMESPNNTLFGSFFRTGPVSVSRSLTPQPQRPLCLIMTRTTVITTITPDHSEAGMSACVPWHVSLERPPVSSHVTVWHTCDRNIGALKKV